MTSKFPDMNPSSCWMPISPARLQWRTNQENIRILQQLWRHRNTGQLQWRDVPDEETNPQETNQ